MKQLLALVFAVGCVSTSQVGPYVKHVERRGDWLMVHRCIIMLEGRDLTEHSCTVERVPLGWLPQVAPPGGPPGTPGTPTMPTAPAPPSPAASARR